MTTVYNAGLPYDSTTMELMCTVSGAIDSYAPGGIPMSGGLVRVETGGTVASWAPGGIPLTTSGYLAFGSPE